MIEVFQSYEHYVSWFSENLYKTKSAQQKLPELGLATIYNNDTVGEPVRALSRQTFLQLESEKGFIQVPNLAD